MDDINDAATFEPTEDLAAQVNRMIVTQLGGRRKRKQSRFGFIYTSFFLWCCLHIVLTLCHYYLNVCFRRFNDSDDEEDVENDAVPFASQAKRHTGEFDLRIFSEVMDVICFTFLPFPPTINLQKLDDCRADTLPSVTECFEEWQRLFFGGPFNVVV